ncbi:MAG TPA: hypothetical protein VK716_03005 [Terracidiphilus sp.]|jgi:hypothetical protein|nr:hypothetical protein [Terracidiphilus sp.]
MRQDVFRVAYEEAQSELLDITVQFEQLKVRKKRLEVAISVMAPLFGDEAKTSKPSGPELVETIIAEPEPAELAASREPVNYTFNEVPVPLPDIEETGGDPFKRRVRNALRFGILGREENGLQPAI